MDLSPGPGSDLLLRILFAHLPDQGPDWSAGYSAGRGVPDCCGVVLRLLAVLGRALALLGFVERPYVDGGDLDRSGGIGSGVPELTASSESFAVLCLFSVLRCRSGRFFRLSVGRYVAGSRI